MIIHEAAPSATPYDVVVLTAGGPLAAAVINAVIHELGEKPGEIIGRWFRLLGARRALGQLAFAPLQKSLSPKETSGPSKQWFYPTAFEYIAKGFKTGLW